MNDTIQNRDAANIVAEMTFRLPTLGPCADLTEDAGGSPARFAGRVRLGGQGPAFRLADSGRVRLGGQGPAFRVADAGRVRLGGQGPIFR